MRVDYDHKKLRLIKTVPLKKPKALSRRNKFLLQGLRGDVVFFAKASSLSDQTEIVCYHLKRDSLDLTE